jgi:hypothetical protein
VPRRKKKSSSRSTLVSTARSVGVDVDVAIVAIVAEVIVAVAIVAIVAEVIVAVAIVSEDTEVVVGGNPEARIPTDLLLLSTSTTRPPSLHWLEHHGCDAIAPLNVN